MMARKEITPQSMQRMKEITRLIVRVNCRLPLDRFLATTD